MGKLIITEFKVEYLNKYTPRSHEKFAPQMISYIEQTIRQSVHIAAIEEESGELVFGGGIVPLWPHVAEGWMLGSDLIVPYAKSTCKYVKSFLEMTMNQLDLHRIQLSVLETETQLATFAKWLGYKEEGLMPCYGPQGETHIRFGKTR